VDKRGTVTRTRDLTRRFQRGHDGRTRPRGSSRGHFRAARSERRRGTTTVGFLTTQILRNRRVGLGVWCGCGGRPPPAPRAHQPRRRHRHRLAHVRRERRSHRRARRRPTAGSPSCSWSPNETSPSSRWRKCPRGRHPRDPTPAGHTGEEGRPARRTTQGDVEAGCNEGTASTARFMSLAVTTAGGHDFTDGRYVRETFRGQRWRARSDVTSFTSRSRGTHIRANDSRGYVPAWIAQCESDSTYRAEGRLTDAPGMPVARSSLESGGLRVDAAQPTHAQQGGYRELEDGRAARTTTHRVAHAAFHKAARSGALSSNPSRHAPATC
jgi:hypothetical protein